MSERSRSASPDDGATDEFGPYVVHELLGQGGMAMVHRAEKRGVGFRRQVALKRLLPHVAEDPELVQLFVDEARLASHLHHANVAQTYELGKVDDTFFIAMEYAPGPTLSQIMRQCQRAACEIPVAISVNLLGQVCDALDYAHNLCDEGGQPLRIIHRDVSPGNIVVTNSGVVKLIDFGIAKATISSVKTQAGFIKGKFGYIAPEYITGSIDSRVDLFAIGVVAHEVLAGRRLFEGKDDFETLDNLRHLVIQPPSKWVPAIPADLDEVVMTALARDPDKRWQTAGSMRIALANVARSLGSVAGSPQVVEWVEWAFSQLPREPDPPPRAKMGNAGRRANDTEEVSQLPGGGSLHDSSVLIQFNEPHGEPPRRELPLPAPADPNDPIPLDKLLVSFNETPAPELLPRTRPDARPRAQTIRPDELRSVLASPQATWPDEPVAAAQTAWHDEPVTVHPAAQTEWPDERPARPRRPSWQDETIAAPVVARDDRRSASVAARLPLPSPVDPDWGDEPVTGRRTGPPSSRPPAEPAFDAAPRAQPGATNSSRPASRPFDAVSPPAARPGSRPFDAVSPPAAPGSRPFESAASPAQDDSESFTAIAPPPILEPAAAAAPRDRANPPTPSPPAPLPPAPAAARDRSNSPSQQPASVAPRDRANPSSAPRDRSTASSQPPSVAPRDRSTASSQPPSVAPRDRSNSPSQQPLSSAPRDRSTASSPPSVALRDRSTASTQPPSVAPRDRSNSATQQPLSSAPRDRSTASSPPSVAPRDRSNSPSQQPPSIAPRDRSTASSQPPSVAPRDRSTASSQPPSVAPRDRSNSATQQPLSSAPRDRSTASSQPPSVAPRDRSNSPSQQPPSVAPRDRSNSPSQQPPSVAPRDRSTAPSQPPSIAPSDRSNSPSQSPSVAPRDRSNSHTQPPPSVAPRDRSQAFSPATLAGAPPASESRDRSQSFVPTAVPGAPPPRDRSYPSTPPPIGGAARDRSYPFAPPQPPPGAAPQPAGPAAAPLTPLGPHPLLTATPSPTRDASQAFRPVVAPGSRPFATVTPPPGPAPISPPHAAPLPGRDSSQPFALVATPPPGHALPGSPSTPPAATQTTSAKRPPAPAGRVDKPRARSEPQRRRTVLWLVLLIIALGIAAMAAAYFWPSNL